MMTICDDSLISAFVLNFEHLAVKKIAFEVFFTRSLQSRLIDGSTEHMYSR